MDTQVDRFVFDTPLNATTNVDTIRNFDRTDSDKIVLENAIFTKLLLASGVTQRALTSAEFTVGKVAADALDRIVYDQGTGSLFYDRDGSGAALATKFAQMKAGLVLAHTDFLVT